MLSPEEKANIRAKMAKTFERFEAVNEIPEGATLLCTHAEDFNRDEDHDFWELPGNQSEIRSDITCAGCSGNVAMSNWMYEKYGALDRKPRVLCQRCLPREVAMQQEDVAVPNDPSIPLGTPRTP